MSHIPPELLEQALNSIGGPLSTVQVRSTNILAPHLAKITGLCNLYGQPHMFETEFNLREIGDHTDIWRLAGMILRSFDKASLH